MHNPESVSENEKYKLLWDFELHTDHLILARRTELVMVNKEKRTCQREDFVAPADRQLSKIKEREKREKYLDLARELKKKRWYM